MTQLTEYRAMKDAMFCSNQSPLPPAERRTFSGLKYFAENPSLRIETRLQPYARPERVQMATSTGHIAEFLKYGHVAFEVDGKTQTLQIYKSEDQDELFLPFMDATTGHETYGSGRYLDAHAKADGTIVLDFNLAYNPYCAYAAHWSCPVPPTENRLSMRIDAGEQTYQ